MSDFRDKIQKLLSINEETSSKRRYIDSSMSITSSTSENSYEVYNGMQIFEYYRFFLNYNNL